MTAILAHGAAAEPYGACPRREISAGVRRLVLLYVWLTVASSAIVFSEPALYDVLMLGAALLLPVVGMVSFNRGLGLYCMMWAVIVAGGYIATTQAGILDVPVTHMSITLYLAFTSVVMAGFVAQSPSKRVKLIMSAYMVAALVAGVAALVGYFGLVPATYDLFTEFGRARGTFKDPNVLGAFLVPALLYAFNEVMSRTSARASLWLALTPILLLGSLLSFSRGAWINLAVSLVIYAGLSFTTVVTHRLRLKLITYVVLAAVFVVGLFAAAQSVPQIAEVMGTRAALEQPYDVGPNGWFGGQIKAVGLILTHPLGIGAQRRSRS